MTYDPRNQLTFYPQFSFMPERRNTTIQLPTTTATTWTVNGGGALITSGAFIANTSSAGAFAISYGTLATTDSVAGYVSTAFDTTDTRLSPKISQFITFDTLSDVRIWCGLFSADPSGSDTLGSIVGAGFRYSTSAGDTSLQIVTSDGSSQTVTDTGFNTFDVNSLGIDIDRTSQLATFYVVRVDETEPFMRLGQHTSSDNFPTDVNLGVVSKITTLANSVATLIVGRVYMEMD